MTNKIPRLASLAFLSVASVCFAVAHFRFSSSRGNPAPGAGLQMRVAVSGEGVLISWNRDDQAVRLAKRGVLQIDDGPQRLTEDLEPGDLANGSLLYRPSTADLNFRLTIYRSNGSTLTDGVLVLDRSEHALRADGGGRDALKLGQPEITVVAIKMSTSQPATQRQHGDERARVIRNQPHTFAATARTNGSPASAVLAPHSTKANAPAPPRLVIARPAIQDPAAGGKTAERYVPPRPLKTVTLNAALFEPSLVAGIKQIDVEVDIDDSGHVTAARALNTAGNTSQLVITTAVAAARQWVFDPARISGKKVAARHMIVFRFGKP